MEDTLLTRYIRILIVVVIYWVVSISLVFCNKALLSGSQTIDAPFFCDMVSVCNHFLRSLTTVFNVLFTYFLLGEKTSVRAVGCCCLIIFGFLLGVNQESEEVDGSIWSLQMYNNLNAIVLFVPLMLIFGEFDVISSYTYLYSLSFWGMMSVGGILGLAIGYVTGLQIKITSPLTHKYIWNSQICCTNCDGHTIFRRDEDKLVVGI
ncbi:SLC35C1 [Lepeophtheirus salmonis]|uniref:SLC35C1 n=1 Tax=Lepeophtheirus salmonis TaxID=72036 RepID=A0A7R8D9Y6_LEPSM|nr:SLC35C1 [Lepeophtheirus salmonis]CAF3021833.1 SLC35C1 [Lepeophtheirus salmonis]